MQSLKSALGVFLRKTGLEKAVAQSTAINSWSEIVGETIAKNADPTEVKHGILTVKVSTPVWRQELQLQKKEILRKLNKKIGKNAIKGIRFI